MADFLSTALDLLKTAAPEVAALVGGPLAGQGVQLIEQTLGLAPTGDAAADAAAASTAVLGASADQLIALKQAGMALQAKFVDAGVQLEQADDADRSNARARAIAQNDWFPAALMTLLTAGFFGLLGYLASHEVPAGSRDLLNIMLGSLGTAWTGGITFFYGSNSGSARAQELLAKAGPVS